VLEVIEAVKRVSGRNFAVSHADRRPGDPAAIVADSAKIQSALGWSPRFDNLDTIVAHALAFERQLAGEGDLKRTCTADAEFPPGLLRLE
jgi:UDP-glucose 4-epimerase